MVGMSRNFTEGALRRRVLTDELDERMDLAGASRVREEEMEETDPERLRDVRDGASTRSLVCPRTGAPEPADDFDVLGRMPMMPDQNDVEDSDVVRSGGESGFIHASG